jgi:hypothetical protein
MRQAKWETLPDDVRAIHEHFEAWRQSRSNRSRIPAALWAAAAGLARRHGVHRVARALGLNDFALRKHALETAPDTAQTALHEQVNAPLPAALDNTPAAPPQPANASPSSSSPAPAFIQLPWPALAATPPPPRCVVELLHPDGARMTITLHDPGGAGHAPAAQPCASGGLDLAALARAFWSQSP